MKRKIVQGKWILSIYLAIMLVLQTLTFSVAAYAEGAADEFSTAIKTEVSSSNEIGPMESEALLEQTAKYTITMKSNSTASENGWIYQNAMVEGIVEWQVEITAVDANNSSAPMPLQGLKFYNMLDHTEQGTYIDGSLVVNEVPVSPDSGTTNELSYTFPAETGNKAKIIYKTWIPKKKYYFEYNAGDSSWQTITNKAELRDASNNILQSSNPWRIALKSDWIQMSGALAKRANPADPRTVVWTIDVNKLYNKQGLKDFNIKTTLPTGLTFKSAAYRLWDNQRNDWSAIETPVSPNASDIYAFGEVNGGIRLAIESEVTGNIRSFTNKAIVEWKLDSNSVQDNDMATVMDTAIVIIGDHTLTSRGEVTADDFNIGASTWTVSLTPQEALPYASVYSLLVYGESIDLEQIDDNPQVGKEILKLIKQRGGTTSEYWQKYLGGSFASKDGLQMEVIPLMKDGIQVADLLRVTGYDSDQRSTFTFRSVQNHPDKFARQGPENGKTRYNRVHLIDGNEYGKYYDGSVNSYGRMLNNELLYASAPAGSNVTPNSVQSYLGDDSSEQLTQAAYDQVTNTVTFRLAVNMTGLKTEEMALDGGNRAASDIRLVNTLPEGWEFVPFSAEKDFELWQGLSGNSSIYQYGSRNDAKTIIEPADPHHVVSFSADKNVGTFHFTKLESPYVILVKARPAQDTLKKYIMSGQTKIDLYNTADLHMKWGDIATVRTDKRKVIVPVNSLSSGNLTLMAEPAIVLGDGSTSIQLTAALSDYKDDAVANTEVVFTLPDQSEQKSTTDVQGKATITYIVPKLVGDQYETQTITALIDSPTEGKLTASTSVIVIPAVISGIVQSLNDKTGAGIENVELTLYYADTPRNKTSGIAADSKVSLPVLSGFVPNDNASPSQNSDVTGSYAYMVYPNTDYYLVATKSGYETYRSSIISVGYNITDYTIKMRLENSGGSNGNGGTLPEPASIVNMIIDGVNYSSLITSEIVQTNGESTAIVKFNEQKLLDMLATKKMDVLTLSAESDVHALVGNLSGRLLDALAANGALLELKKGRATYSLPVDVLNISQVTKSLQAGNDLESIIFTMKISETSKEKAEMAHASAAAAGLTVAAEPIDFDMEAQYGDKRITVNQFSGFIKRTLSVLDRVGATATLTGALLDEQGNLLPVPTRTVMSNGNRHAVISSMTNSTYVLVQGKKAFSDLPGHWSEKDVNEMAARLVVHGVDKYRFAPDRTITRAEFAAIMIRALGLNLTHVRQDFKDVGAADWYADHVAAASALGLIKGYEDGTFRPNQIITRSEASVILVRALELAAMDTAMSEDEANKQIGAYMDAAKTPDWAKRFLAAAIKAGIIQGDKQQRLIPEGSVTRAQAAVMMKRLLQRADLIDK